MSLKMYQKPGDRWLCLQSYGLTIKLYKKCLLNHNSVICRSVDTFWKPIHIYFLFSFLFLIVLCLAQRHLLKMYVSFFFIILFFRRREGDKVFGKTYTSILLYLFINSCVYFEFQISSKVCTFPYIHSDSSSVVKTLNWRFLPFYVPSLFRTQKIITLHNFLPIITLNNILLFTFSLCSWSHNYYIDYSTCSSCYQHVL